MAWHGMPWHGMPWHGTAWHGMACHGMAWHGMACHGMAWHGMPWHAMAWHAYWHAMACHAMVWHTLASLKTQESLACRLIFSFHDFELNLYTFCQYLGSRQNSALDCPDPAGLGVVFCQFGRKSVESTEISDGSAWNLTQFGGFSSEST